jgi:sec-independent protein translocase protein TatB
MFDLTSTKLLILGVVALLVVGPKDLPILLRTLGKYVGMIRRQADEFRQQFNDAMRESELQSLKEEVEKLGREAEQTVREAETTFNAETQAITGEVDSALASIEPAPATAEPTLPANGALAAATAASKVTG